MANRVVSTKLSEEEHKKILEICSSKGITVSKLLKKTLMERIREEKQKKHSSFNLKRNSQNSYQQNTESDPYYQKKTQFSRERDLDREDRFMYY